MKFWAKVRNKLKDISKLKILLQNQRYQYNDLKIIHKQKKKKHHSLYKCIK